MKHWNLRRLSVLALLSLPISVPAQDTENPIARLADLDIELLLKIEVKSASGLTKTDSRHVPVSLTEINAETVEESGARDLNQLLEIYVPNAQLIDHHHLQSHVGFRGIISDREDKYLFQVNGRTMNNRMSYGADNERAIPLLGDIRAVNVARGPASATHGAGALAGVINLIPHNGLTFEGADFKLRQGFGDFFSAAEARFGKKFSSTSGFFGYYGVADQPGAETDYYLGKSYPARNGLPANVAGQPVKAPLANFGSAGFGQLRHKAHASYVSGPFEVWTRLVQDGNQNWPLREIYTTAKPEDLAVEDWVRGRQLVSRQFTVTGTYSKELSPTWSLNLMESLDYWWLEEQRMGTQVAAPGRREAGEREIFSRGILVWSPAGAHSLGFGSEYSRERFDDPSFSDALDRVPVVSQREWSTNTVSFLAEYQWKINPRWTSYISARTDKHTFSNWFLSPRVSIVYTPNERDTLKLMAGKSLRRGGDEELWAQQVRLRTIPNPESLRSYEFSYSRKMRNRWSAGINAFFEDYDAIGWVPALYTSTSIGKFRMAGGELMMELTRGRTRITLSEGVTQLVDSAVPATLPAAGQAVTAQPYGYGNDLANWANFVTKAVVQHNLTAKWRVSTSVIHYSGFPGAKAYAAYSSTFTDPPSAMPVSDAGYNTPYGANLFWNTGLEFKASDNWKVRLDGYNLVGLMDRTLSKRNYYFRLSEFNVKQPSLTLSLSYWF
jgi:outer membrane receptor protein involved in Fe transport